MAEQEGELSKEQVLELAKEHDVKFIRLWFTDILGMLKSFAITVEELEGALEEGMGFDGSSIEGFARIDESDMVAMPDPHTFQLLPWRPREHRAVAQAAQIHLRLALPVGTKVASHVARGGRVVGAFEQDLVLAEKLAVVGLVLDLEIRHAFGERVLWIHHSDGKRLHSGMGDEPAAQDVHQFRRAIG